MEALLIRLFIGIGVIWLTQVVETALEIKEPANKVIFLVVVALMVLFIVLGGSVGIKLFA